MKPTTVVLRGATGAAFPDRALVKMRYNDTNNGQFTNNGVIYVSRRWRMNSAYDPDPSLGSGSMAGFSEYSLLYNNYIVKGFKYEVWIVNKEAGPTGVPCQVIVAPTTHDVGLNYSSIDELIELPFAKNAVCSTQGGMDKVHFKGYIPLAKLYGDYNKYNNDPAFSAAVNTNPSTMFYFNVGAYALGGTLGTQGVACSARFTYYVEFYNRRDIFG